VIAHAGSAGKYSNGMISLAKLLFTPRNKIKRTTIKNNFIIFVKVKFI